MRDIEHASAGPMGGAIFENLVVSDLHKIYLHRGEAPSLYFWRTAAGAEVDVVINTQNALIPLEIKKSETPRAEMVKGLIRFQYDFKQKARAGYVIHPGKTLLPLGLGVFTLPLMNL